MEWTKDGVLMRLTRTWLAAHINNNQGKVGRAHKKAAVNKQRRLMEWVCCVCAEKQVILWEGGPPHQTGKFLTQTTCKDCGHVGPCDDCWVAVPLYWMNPRQEAITREIMESIENGWELDNEVEPTS